ncbi:uncharacterized protein V6R79_025647 [Siganus canaliculatus]
MAWSAASATVFSVSGREVKPLQTLNDGGEDALISCHVFSASDADADKRTSEASRRERRRRRWQREVAAAAAPLINAVSLLFTRSLCCLFLLSTNTSSTRQTNNRAPPFLINVTARAPRRRVQLAGE